jgi:hypothetical protein
MEEIATELGKNEDVENYKEYKEGCKKAYQALVQTKEFDLDTDRQAQLVRPLALDLLNEKQKEFAGEGVRLFDIKRQGKQIVKKGNFGSGTSIVIKDDDYRWLFPIPESEYKYNDLMDQNPEWPFIKTE